MANAWYDKGKESLQEGSIDLTSDDIRVALVDTGTYTYSVAHEFFSSVEAAVIGTPVSLTGKTVVGPVFDADSPVVFADVTGDTLEAFVIYKWTGSAATSSLLAYFDTVSSGLPLTPNGGSINLNFHASGIWAL